MTNAELKEALMNKRPVVVTTNDGAILHCRCVSGIVYREKGGKVIVSGEVLDRNGNCLYNCDPKNIRYEV